MGDKKSTYPDGLASEMLGQGLMSPPLRVEVKTKT